LEDRGRGALRLRGTPVPSRAFCAICLLHAPRHAASIHAITALTYSFSTTDSTDLGMEHDGEGREGEEGGRLEAFGPLTRLPHTTLHTTGWRAFSPNDTHRASAARHRLASSACARHLLPTNAPAAPSRLSIELRRHTPGGVLLVLCRPGVVVAFRQLPGRTVRAGDSAGGRHQAFSERT